MGPGFPSIGYPHFWSYMKFLGCVRPLHSGQAKLMILELPLPHRKEKLAIPFGRSNWS